jgi:hypothetical protein
MGMDLSAFAMCALGTLGAAVPATVQIELSDGHRVRPNSWIALVGDPSTGKSPVIAACNRPLRKLDDEAAQRHQQALSQWEAAKTAPSPTGQKPQLPPKPAEPTTYVSDSMTPEALTEVLAKQDRGLLMESDELTMWIGAMERTGRQGANPDRGFWLRSYNGGSYSSVRISRGRTRVNNLCVSVMGGIQPDVLQRMRGNITDDGLLQRFIPVIMKTKDIGTGAGFAREADAYGDLVRLATAVPQNSVIRLDDQAKAVFHAFKQMKHQLETSDTVSKGFRGFAGKLDKVFGFLCAVLLVGDAGSVVTCVGNMLVGRDIAERAARIIRSFVIPHAYEVFGLTTNGATDIDTTRAIASFLLTDTGGRLRYTASDLTTGVRNLRGASRAQVFDAVAPLVAGGWLEPEAPHARKDQKAYLLNPHARTLQARRAEDERLRKHEVQALIRGAAPRGGHDV